MQNPPPLTPAAIVMSIVVIGAIIYSVTSPSSRNAITVQNAYNTSSTTAIESEAQAQLDAKNAEIANLKAQLTQAQTQSSKSAQIDPSIAIERCKAQATNFARLNAQQQLNEGISYAQSRGDYQTAAMYMTENPKIVASYTPDYETEYARCLNSL